MINWEEIQLVCDDIQNQSKNSPKNMQVKYQALVNQTQFNTGTR
jgi:hypothetical protein